MAHPLRPGSPVWVRLMSPIVPSWPEADRNRPTFPDTCIAPDQPGFGQIISGDARRRRSRRVAGPTNAGNHSWNIMSPVDQSSPPQGRLPPIQQQFYSGSPLDAARLSSTPRELPLSPNPPTPTSRPDSPRYGQHQSSYLSQRPEVYASHPSDQSHLRRPASTSLVVREGPGVSLPPVHQPSSNYVVSLPSVADLVKFNAMGDRDPPKAILERLKHGDSSVHHSPTSLAALLRSLILAANGVDCAYRSRPPNEVFGSGQPSSRFPPFSAPPYGDVSPSAPAFVSYDERVYVTEVPQIHDLDHSSRSESETRGEISGGGLPRSESDTIASDAYHNDASVRRPLRPW